MACKSDARPAMETCLPTPSTMTMPSGITTLTLISLHWFDGESPAPRQREFARGLSPSDSETIQSRRRLAEFPSRPRSTATATIELHNRIRLIPAPSADACRADGSTTNNRTVYRSLALTGRTSRVVVASLVLARQNEIHILQIHREIMRMPRPTA